MPGRRQSGAWHQSWLWGRLMASTSKSLAQSNKSQDVGKATNKHSALRDAAGRKRPNSTSIRSANLPRPVNGWGFFRPWQRRTNVWRGRTNLRTGSERLRGVGPPRGGGAPYTHTDAPPARSLELLAWLSTLRCIGDTGNENLRQRHSNSDDLCRHFLGVHGAAASFGASSHDGRNPPWRHALVQLVNH
jgi:hypothetical protein